MRADSFVAACSRVRLAATRVMLQLLGERSELESQAGAPLMHTTARHTLKRPTRLRFLALLAIPLLLLLHAPVLAALVPGALLTISALDSLEQERRALPSATIVGDGDLLDLQRAAAATPVTGTSRRIG
jgi:hypothetical protein